METVILNFSLYTTGIATFKYLTYKEYNPTGILIYLLGFTLFSQKKDSSTVSDTAAFLHCLYFIFFSDTVYLFIYYSEIYSKSLLTVILYSLTFQIIYIIFIGNFCSLISVLLEFKIYLGLLL